MSVETIVMFTAEAAAGSAVRALYDDEPVLFGAVCGFLAGVTLFVLPQEAATAVLSVVVVVPFAASQITHEVIMGELKEKFFG